MGKEIKIKQYKELPYTIVAHSCLLPAFHISLTGGGIKKLAKLMSKEDRVSITVYHDRASEFVIHKREKSK